MSASVSFNETAQNSKESRMSIDNTNNKSRRKSNFIYNSISDTISNVLVNNDDGNNDNSTSNNTDKWLEIKNIKRNYWKEEEELLLQEWADKAQCYEWMHFKAHEKYKSQNNWFTIPVIIISTLTGTANFAQERFGDSVKPYVAMGVGGANIIAGLITTIYQFLKIAELNESHKIAYTEWGKLYRKVKTELTKHPFDRENHTLFMSFSKKEYDRLIETCPSIPKDIVTMFNKKHRKVANLIKPEICNAVDAIKIFKMDEDERQAMVDELNEDTVAAEEAKEREHTNLRNNLYLLKEEYDKLKKEYNKLQRELNNINNKPQDVIIEIDENLEKFKKSFNQVNGRMPDEEEIKTLYNEIYLMDNAEMIDLNDNDESSV